MDAVTGVSATGNPSARSGANYFDAVFGALVYEDFSTGKVVPWMSQSLTMTDPTHWVLKLRPGVTFSDGTPFDADAVQSNWNRLGSNGYRARALHLCANGCHPRTVVNSTTLDITLVAANTEFDRTVAKEFPWIESPTAYAANPAAFATDPIGAGPFVVQSFNPTTGNLVLNRNTTYWDKPLPYLDHLTILGLGANDTTRYSAFASGQADLMNSLGSSTFPLAQSSGVKMVNGTAKANGGTNFIFNTTRAPFNDPNARKAFIEAINPAAFNSVLYGQAGAVTPAVFAKSSPYYCKCGVFPKYDPKKAQAYFNAYAARTGGPLNITFATASSTTSIATASYLQAQLAGYQNVTLNTDVIGSAVYVSTLAAGAFDIAFFNITNYDPMQDFQDFFTTGGSRNFGKYSNPTVDNLVAQGFAATTQAAKVKVVDQLQKILVGNGELWYPAQLQAWILSDSKVGAAPYFSTGDFRWDQVWVKKS
jgi:peptide/nickel transport system substrate-binding protein